MPKDSKSGSKSAKKIKGGGNKKNDAPNFFPSDSDNDFSQARGKGI
ncbi:MAG: hypothetical protein LBL09_00670 [Oscillospiraceae bacterium]|jgi:hypothetical protein|nr:hypothetical protein [Oscillospiraceae bacterium]